MNDSREEVAARINALWGVTADDPVMRVVRKTRNAQRDASHCADCEREIKPSEPVWRFRVSWHSYIGCSHNLAPHCEQCSKSHWRSFRKAEACEGCGRPVYNEWHSLRPRRSVCSEQCRHKATSAAAKRKRSEARGTRQCQDCGKTFKPTRSDARFCSVACKQRAYRKRVRNSRCRARRGCKSRNGAAP